MIQHWGGCGVLDPPAPGTLFAGAALRRARAPATRSRASGFSGLVRRSAGQHNLRGARPYFERVDAELIEPELARPTCRRDRSPLDRTPF